ncbi:hypothetical protein D3C87_870500 [compost metagenome]
MQSRKFAGPFQSTPRRSFGRSDASQPFREIISTVPPCTELSTTLSTCLTAAPYGIRQLYGASRACKAAPAQHSVPRSSHV